eukprot:6897895-Lingulodinium_polyedra.AAC.1
MHTVDNAHVRTRAYCTAHGVQAGHTLCAVCVCGMPCRAVLCRAMQRSAVQCSGTQRNATHRNPRTCSHACTHACMQVCMLACLWVCVSRRSCSQRPRQRHAEARQCAHIYRHHNYSPSILVCRKSAMLGLARGSADKLLAGGLAISYA